MPCPSDAALCQILEQVAELKRGDLACVLLYTSPFLFFFSPDSSEQKIALLSSDV